MYFCTISLKDAMFCCQLMLRLFDTRKTKLNFILGTDLSMMVFWDLEQDPYLFEIYATDPDDLQNNFNCEAKPEFFTHNYTEPGDYTITAK